SSNVYVAGHTDSNDFLVDEFNDNAFQGETQGNRDAFVLKIQEKRSIQRFDVVSGCGVNSSGLDQTDVSYFLSLLILVAIWVTTRKWRRGLK
ncbi:MAG: hypothetical protein GTN76_00465, partial [Candidatus Aenigmarchaeota archaeon]|nr:hypothetical protein [Candidatus Aenigmarchaeota archaeon]